MRTQKATNVWNVGPASQNSRSPLAWKRISADVQRAKEALMTPTTDEMVEIALNRLIYAAELLATHFQEAASSALH